MEISVNNHDIKILSPISENDKSRVFLAQKDREIVVLKMLEGDDKSELYKRIQNLGSPYFPRILEMEYRDNTTYILEEYLSGKELSLILREDISRADGYRYMEELSKAVSTLHSLTPAIIHRDIKPENIIITEKNELKLLDFDAVREYKDDNQTQDTKMLGTKGYAAPEQYGFSQTDERSDIYSVGIVCHEIADKIKLNEPEKRNLNKALDKATMFDPNKRYSSIEKLLGDIKKSRKTLLKLSIQLAALLLLTLIASIAISTWSRNEKALKEREARESDLLKEQALLTEDYIQLPPSSDPSLAEENLPTGMDIMPDDYVYTPIAYECSRYLECDDSEDFLHEYNFYKSNPQALIYYSHLFEDKEIVRITAERYTEGYGSLIEKLAMDDCEDCFIDRGFICVGTKTLSGIYPGYYVFYFELSDESTWSVKIMTHSSDIRQTDPEFGLWGPIQYYSLSRENDIFFNVLDTTSSIASVAINEEAVSDGDYLVTKDYRGLVVKGQYLQQFKNETELQITIEMNNGSLVTGKIILIQ